MHIQQAHVARQARERAADVAAAAAFHGGQEGRLHVAALREEIEGVVDVAGLGPAFARCFGFNVSWSRLWV